MSRGARGTEERGRFTQSHDGRNARRRSLDRIAELGLETNAAELDELGFTVVEDAAPLELFDRIRDAIVEMTDEVRERGDEPFNFGPNTSMVYRLLRKPAVAEAVLTPKLTAIMSCLLGDGYAESVATGSILEPGSFVGPLHSDNQFFPEPFPTQVQVATAIWCCDDFSDELGSTHIVPGSNHECRHPRLGEGVDAAVPVVAPRGSIVIWVGNTWHRSGARTAPGRRIALHTAFSRPHLKVFEAYAPEDVARLVAFDKRFTRLLGADLPYDYTGETPDVNKIIAIAATTQAQD